jgi:hypothetical protein
MKSPARDWSPCRGPGIAFDARKGLKLNTLFGPLPGMSLPGTRRVQHNRTINSQWLICQVQRVCDPTGLGTGAL